MDMHSLGSTILNVLANLVSKFATESRIIIRDSGTGGYVKVTVSAPYRVSSASTDKEGNIKVEIAGHLKGEVENG